MAELLNFSPAVLLGAQTGGGFIGNMLCPGNMLLGATTADILGQEGEILKKVIPLGTAVALLRGVVIRVVAF